jgi:hypothetical protein
MVTAGVYLLIRSSPLIEYSSTVLLICLWLGALTTVFSSIIGLFQQDIKKVIAYSTMSQLAREYIFHSNIFRHQTICVEAINKLIILANSQITKARDYYNHYNFKFFNSSTIIRFLHYVIIGWKFGNIRKLVGISEAIRLILIFLGLILVPKFSVFDKHILNTSINKNYNLSSHFTKKVYSRIFTRNISTSINNNTKNLAFKEWLAGIIDGDGYFLLSKNGYNSCEITMDTRDKKVLYLIQQQYSRNS